MQRNEQNASYNLMYKRTVLTLDTFLLFFNFYFGLKGQTCGPVHDVK